MTEVKGNSESGSIQISEDKFSKLFYFVIPWTVPVIVTLVTYLFYPLTLAANMVWLPLLIIYWATIWSYAILYRLKRGGVFNRERFKPTIFLKGKYLWLQYIVTYGPLTYAIPLFILNYGITGNLTVNMYIAMILAAIMNGPTEEIYWRASMEDAGINAGVSEKWRLIYTPIAFSLWHTAFVIHLYPWDANWFYSWGAVILMTWASGLVWHWVLHRSGRLVPQCIYHAIANFLNIFPLMLVTVLQISF